MKSLVAKRWIALLAMFLVNMVCLAGNIMLEGRYGLPRGIERLRLFGLPAEGEACRCRFTLREQNATGSWYDFHLVDAAGRCLLIAENHHIASLTRRA